MNNRKRNMILAAMAAVVFLVAAFIIVRPAFRSSTDDDQPGTADTSETTASTETADGKSDRTPSTSTPGTKPKSNTRSVTLGGATVSNKYPELNFSSRFNGETCAIFTNDSESVPVTIISVDLSPADTFERYSCFDSGYTYGVDDGNGKTTTIAANIVPCSAGIILLPAGRESGCSLGVRFLRDSDVEVQGQVNFALRAVCISDTASPCNLLKKRGTGLHPTTSTPVTLTITQSIGINGINPGPSTDTDTEDPSGTVTPTESPSETPTA